MTQETLNAIIGYGAGLVSAGICGYITWLVSRNSNALQQNIATDYTKVAERTTIDNQIVKMIEFAIEYPHLENKEWISKYNREKKNRETDQYENYCCFVFTIIYKVFNHFEQNKEKINNYLNVYEIVCMHKLWWMQDPINNFSYSERFKYYIEEIIRDCSNR